MDLRFEMRPQAIAPIPQPTDESGGNPPGSTRALIGGVEADPLGFEAVDAALGVVACHFVEASVHDRRDARNRQRCFGDVGRHDHSRPRGWLERAALRVYVERSM